MRRIFSLSAQLVSMKSVIKFHFSCWTSWETKSYLNQNLVWLLLNVCNLLERWGIDKKTRNKLKMNDSCVNFDCFECINRREHHLPHKLVKTHRNGLSLTWNSAAFGSCGLNNLRLFSQWCTIYATCSWFFARTVKWSVAWRLRDIASK